MQDLTPYILTNIQEIHDLEAKHGQRFKDYLNKVYLKLMQMPYGGSFDIAKSIKEPNLELFIKCACLFVLESKGTYEFTDEYRVIRRLHNPQMIKEKSNWYNTK